MCLIRDFWHWVTEMRIYYVEGLPGIHSQLKAILQKKLKKQTNKKNQSAFVAKVKSKIGLVI